jgi:PAS domain S-box-containing protein
VEAGANLEVGYGLAKGEDSFAVGAAAARQALRSIRQHPVSAVLVFASGGQESAALLRGLRSELGQAPLLGAASAGAQTPEEPPWVEMVALASPHLRVKVGMGRRFSRDRQRALIEAITGPEVAPFFASPDNAIWSALARRGHSAFALLFSPEPHRGADAPGWEMLETLQRLSQGRLPILGTGAAAGGRPAGRSVLWGSRSFPDSLLLAVFETGLQFGWSLAPGRQVLGAAGAEALRQALQRGAIDDPAAVLVFAGGRHGAGAGAPLAAQLPGFREPAAQVPVLEIGGFQAWGLTPDSAPRPGDEAIAVLALGRELSAGALLARENELLRREVTDLQQAADAFRSLVDHAPIGIFIIQEGKFRLVNPGFLRLTGYSAAELLGVDSLRCVAEAAKVRSAAVKMLKGERTTPYEFQIITKSGETRWVMETVTSIQYRGERAVLGFFMDISEHASLKNQFLQAQKMEAVGRLAGGVAHDFNNMLTAIMGYCEIVMMSFREDDPIFLHLEGIRKSAERAATLTRQLMAFSRKQVLQLRVTNLNTVVADLEKLLRRLIGEDIELVIELEPGLKMVKADPGQVEQVLMNLVINARDAMPLGGKLIIRTANVELDEGFTSQRVELLPGPYVRVSVIDQGLGMAPETLPHIFEPFFTTKEAGKGTGLGLSTVYGIIKQSGGHIEVTSKPGEGAVFDLYFRQLEDAVEEPRDRLTPAALPQGTETVLVVEDDDILLNLIKDALQMQGYQVLTAHNGSEAEALCRRHPAPIHLLLTDVVMPRQNGGELAARLTPLHPEMKILYMSGYSEDALAVQGLVEAARPLLQKPFPPLELVRKVREMLDLRN